jgi:AcrR family transcriptional regulator
MADSNAAGALPIWARAEPATRQPRFSRDQIAGTALAIADAYGFEAVSMRKIAAALGAGTMSLYRYIATKDDLLALIDDAIVGEALVPTELPADWRVALAQVARYTRQAFLHHPWAVQALQGGPAGDAALSGPNRLRHFEQSLAAVAGAPLDTTGKLDLLAIIDDYVFGHLLRAAEITARSAASQDSVAGIAGGFTADQLRSGDFPQLAALTDDPAARTVSDAGRMNEQFERGLRVLIDGFASGTVDKD